MEWKILGQVLWHVFGTITVAVLTDGAEPKYIGKKV